MKVLQSKTQYDIVETEFEYPIFFHLQDDDAVDNTYIRYTENERLEIKFELSGRVTVSNSSHNKEYPLPEYLFHHKSCTDTFDDALMDLDDFMDKIN